MPRLKPDATEARRNAILAAAARCFRAQGFHQTSIKDICTEGDFSPGALYLYFPSKEALIEGLIEAQMAEAQQMMRDLPDQPDLLGTLVDLVAAWVEETRAQGNMNMIADIFAEGLRNPRVANVIAADNKKLHQLYIKAVASAQKRGEIAPHLDPASVATLLLSLCDGMMMRFAVDPDFDPSRMLTLLRSVLGSAIATFSKPQLVSSRTEER